MFWWECCDIHVLRGSRCLHDDLRSSALILIPLHAGSLGENDLTRRERSANKHSTEVEVRLSSWDVNRLIDAHYLSVRFIGVLIVH